MKNILVLILLTVCVHCSYAQVKTVYFDAKDQVTTDSSKTYSFGIYGKLTGSDLWVFKKYDIYDNLLVTGAFKDDSLKVAQGKFVYYDWIDMEDGFKNLNLVNAGKARYMVLSGSFENDMKEGQWIGYYEDGEVKTVMTYEADVLHGPFKLFDEKGQLREGGSFIKGKREGNWIQAGGLREVTYENDKPVAEVKKTKRQLKEEQQRKKQ